MLTQTLVIMAVPDGAFETTQGREIDALMAQVGLRGSAPAVESPAAVAEPEIDAGDPDVVVLTPAKVGALATALGANSCPNAPSVQSRAG